LSEADAQPASAARELVFPVNLLHGPDLRTEYYDGTKVFWATGAVMRCEIIQISNSRALGARERQAAPCGSDCDRNRVLRRISGGAQESGTSAPATETAKNSRSDRTPAMQWWHADRVMITGDARMDWYTLLRSPKNTDRRQRLVSIG